MKGNHKPVESNGIEWWLNKKQHSLQMSRCMEAKSPKWNKGMLPIKCKQFSVNALAAV